MQLLSVNTARAIWLIETKDLNPRGKNIDVGMVEWLKTTYQFQRYPSFPIEDVETKGLVFSGGRFLSGTEDDGKEKYIYIDLTIFNDGLVANTRSSTKDSDEFLANAIISAAGEFHLAYDPKMIRRKLYLSELDVRTDKSLSLLNPKLEQFEAEISSTFPSSPPTTFDLSAISFGADPSIQQWRPSPFTLERKLNTELAEHRYYSKAPLHTDDHFRLLEKFEELLVQ